MEYKFALVFGAGAFGTSIASVLSENFETVIVKVRSQDVYDSIKQGENSVYLPGQKLAKNIIPALTWEEVDELTTNHKVELLVNGLPTSAINPFYSQNLARIKKYLADDTPFVSISKGIDPETLELSDDLFMNHFPHFQDQITYLSGPSFAKEIVDKQVTIVALAGKSPDVLLDICKKMGTEYFKCMPTYDIKGVLLGGALKNILAIAGGILEGLGYNHNTRAAMITRGINEMLRFGKVFNGRPETFYSFAGMGDLILTTTSSLSRNKTFGVDIATSGKSPDEIIKSQRSVVEGYKTTKAAYNLAKKYKIKAPLFYGVYQILYKNVDPQDVLKKLMKLPINIIE
ncbi:MAG: NAD(P)-dependent glycerol-3-phosphate dehydrogenase [Halobacteriovoraceae bacterium]|nr:NAD(P)-dependent glycerol-3-phosphate dehydrogenase [Halobacteriovoraceae bacterium]